MTEQTERIGAGRYSWIDLQGILCYGTHWDDLPAEMDRIVSFVPTPPPPPHTDEVHAEMAKFDGRLQEAMKRCRR